VASITTTTTSDGEARYRVRYRVNGRLVERWFRREADARAHKVRAESDALDGVAIDPRLGARTLDDYAAQWIATRLVKGRPLSPSTAVGYRRVYARNIGPRIGARPLRQLRPDVVRAWHAEVATVAGQDQAAKAYRLLRAVLATAVADDLIRQNPCRIRGAGQEHADERPMVETSLVLDLADAITPAYRALVLLAGFGGLRTGESLGLHVEDVDLLHATVRIVRQAQEIAGQGRTEGPPKSEAGRRTVSLPGIVVEALGAHLAGMADPAGTAPLFCGPEGGALRRATLTKAWAAAVRSTGAPDGLHLHDLRHHAATLTARTPGVTTKELMARIGHSSPRAALIYQHATAERDRAVACW